MRIQFIGILIPLLLLSVSASADDLSGLMPKAVGDMHRLELLTGQAAQDAVDKLHGKPLPAEASVMARYSAPEDVASARPAEVWVSRVESKREARRQTGVMVHLMYENPRSPFKNPRRSDRNGIAVYRFEGMGQAHFIWHKNDLVWWVSVAADNESVMLETFCN